MDLLYLILLKEFMFQLQKTVRKVIEIVLEVEKMKKRNIKIMSMVLVLLMLPVSIPLVKANVLIDEVLAEIPKEEPTALSGQGCIFVMGRYTSINDAGTFKGHMFGIGIISYFGTGHGNIITEIIFGKITAIRITEFIGFCTFGRIYGVVIGEIPYVNME